MKFLLKNNSDRKGCKDVFKSFILKDATYGGNFEFPVLEKCDEIPNSVISFSRTLKTDNYNQWVHFYEDDYLFERLWNNPEKYLTILKRYKGVILPDFSLYRDMPLVMQLFNIYRSRAIGHWLQVNGIKVIPNMRYGDRRTFRISCDGIAKHGVIAVGSHGCLKNKTDREIFFKGLEVVIRILKPTTIIVYGSAPKKIFDKYRDMGIRIIQFESDYSISHKEVE